MTEFNELNNAEYYKEYSIKDDDTITKDYIIKSLEDITNEALDNVIKTNDVYDKINKENKIIHSELENIDENINNLNYKQPNVEIYNSDNEQCIIKESKQKINFNETLENKNFQNEYNSLPTNNYNDNLQKIKHNTSVSLNYNKYIDDNDYDKNNQKINYNTESLNNEHFISPNYEINKQNIDSDTLQINHNKYIPIKNEYINSDKQKIDNDKYISAHNEYIVPNINSSTIKQQIDNNKYMPIINESDTNTYDIPKYDYNNQEFITNEYTLPVNKLSNSTNIDTPISINSKQNIQKDISLKNELANKTNYKNKQHDLIPNYNKFIENKIDDEQDAPITILDVSSNKINKQINNFDSENSRNKHLDYENSLKNNQVNNSINNLSIDNKYSEIVNEIILLRNELRTLTDDLRIVTNNLNISKNNFNNIIKDVTKNNINKIYKDENSDIDNTIEVLEINELWNTNYKIVKLTADGWKGYKIKAFTKSKKLPLDVSNYPSNIKKYYTKLYNKYFLNYINNFNEEVTHNDVILEIKQKFKI
jgi:hypothetical protein